jgi:hypothetical protein
MTIEFLELSLPFVMVAAAWLARAYANIAYPRPRALGEVLPKLNMVDANAILNYNQALEHGYPLSPHTAKALRRNQIRINRIYMNQIARNTKLLQQVVRFEKLKIHPGRSSFDYDQREMLVLLLRNELTAARWKIAKALAGLRWREILGLKITQESLTNLMAQYKQFEHEMLKLADLGEDECSRQMLVDRLGLINWNLYDGGSSTSA